MLSKYKYKYLVLTQFICPSRLSISIAAYPLFSLLHQLCDNLSISSKSSTMDFDKEKNAIEEVERTVSEVSNDAHIAEFSPEEQRKIIRRVDFRLVTTLGFLYMCSLMDRTNLGAANIAG